MNQATQSITMDTNPTPADLIQCALAEAEIAAQKLSELDEQYATKRKAALMQLTHAQGRIAMILATSGLPRVRPDDV